jgi:menaquinone-dependent protoporphyrinogen oxidase
MCEVPVFYATTEGQARRIAERFAERLRARGFASLAMDIGNADRSQTDWSQVRGVVLGASLHAGKHQASALAFARAHAADLNARPSVFFSVSLSAASKHPEERAAAQRLAKEFAAQASWRPWRTVCVAGRLAYTQYGFIKRLLMRMIAKREGGSTDTSRDHEYTDWAAIEQLANAMADILQRDADIIALGA